MLTAKIKSVFASPLSDECLSFTFEETGHSWLLTERTLKTLISLHIHTCQLVPFPGVRFSLIALHRDAHNTSYAGRNTICIARNTIYELCWPKHAIDRNTNVCNTLLACMMLQSQGVYRRHALVSGMHYFSVHTAFNVMCDFFPALTIDSDGIAHHLELSQRVSHSVIIQCTKMF